MHFTAMLSGPSRAFFGQKRNVIVAHSADVMLALDKFGSINLGK